MSFQPPMGKMTFVTDAPLVVKVECIVPEDRRPKVDWMAQAKRRSCKEASTRILRELKRIHAGDSWSMVEEALRDGRRADLVASHASGFSVAYEIKSYSEDLTYELCNPEKSLPWRLKADHFYFVMPDFVFGGLRASTKKKFPDGSGIMLINESDSSFKIERPAVFSAAYQGSRS